MPRGNERAEAVSGRAREVDDDRVGWQSLPSESLCHLIAQESPNRAIDVANRDIDGDGTPVAKRTFS